MKISTIVFLIYFMAFTSYAENLHSRSYSLEEIKMLLTGYSGEIVDDFTTEEIVPKLKKFLNSMLTDHRVSTEVKTDEKKALVHISSDLRAMYQIHRNLSQYWDTNVKCKVDIVEVKNIPGNWDYEILTKPEKLKQDPNINIVSSFELTVKNGETGTVKVYGQTLKINPYMFSFRPQTEIDLIWTQELLFRTHFESRFYILDKTSQIFQIQSAGEKGRKNLFMVVSVNLLDNDLKPIKRFLKKDIENLRKKLLAEKKREDKVITRCFAIPAGILEVVSMGPGGLGDDNGDGLGALLEEDDDGGPSFAKAFEKIGVKFGPQSKLKFVQGLMKLIVTAKKSDQDIIEKHIKKEWIGNLQRNVHFQLLEVPNALLKNAPKKMTVAYIESLDKEKVKLLESFSTIAFDGKTVKFEEGKGLDKDNKLDVHITCQTDFREKLSEVELKLDYSKLGKKFKSVQKFEMDTNAKIAYRVNKNDGESIFVLLTTSDVEHDTEFWYE